ncbi:MAG: hypothetical protein KDD60_04675 [Bdellovibrionales bacterium]|nr:hypothetical protein [Bdellovibrionales bacterium]
MRIATAGVMSSCLFGCATDQPKPETPQQRKSDTGLLATTQPEASSELTLNTRLQKLAKKPLKPEETGELLDTAAGNFFYGPGLGETALDVAGIVAFPPYALVLLGNSILSLAGQEPLSISQVLPEKTKQEYRTVMDNLYSGPGLVVSGAAGEEYRDRQAAEAKWEEFVTSVEKRREHDTMQLFVQEK